MGVLASIAVHAAALVVVPPPQHLMQKARAVTAPILARLAPLRVEPRVQPPAQPQAERPAQPRPLERRIARKARPAKQPAPRISEPSPPPAPLAETPAPAAPAAPVAAAPQPAPAVPLSEPVFDAAYLENPSPSYPSMSRRLHEQGRVILRVLVNAAGRADEVQLRASSGHSRLDDTARDTVKRWRFVPARRGAEPVPAWVLVPISFSLES